MQDYKKLLERGLKKIPKGGEDKGRFEIPKAIGSKEGLRTVVNNFYEIATKLRRDPQHLLKFLLKELATKRELRGQRLILQGIFPSELIDKKIDLYVKLYVICPECGKPDTKLIKEDRIMFMKCEACGAKHPVGKV